jgi:hypothetical protein
MVIGTVVSVAGGDRRFDVKFARAGVWLVRGLAE